MDILISAASPAVSPITRFPFHISLFQDSVLFDCIDSHNQSPPSQLLRPLLILHPLHNPPARLLRILLRLLAILHRLLHLREIIRHIHALVDRWPLLNRLQPDFHFGESSRFHARPLAPVGPREDTDVAQRVLLADQVRGFAVRDGVDFALRGETVVEDLVEALGFGLVAVDGVGEFFGGVCVYALVRFCLGAFFGLNWDIHLKKWFAWPCMGPMPDC